jgi:hypothetical protein
MQQSQILVFVKDWPEQISSKDKKKGLNVVSLPYPSSTVNSLTRYSIEKYIW